MTWEVMQTQRKEEMLLVDEWIQQGRAEPQIQGAAEDLGPSKEMRRALGEQLEREWREPGEEWTFVEV